MSFYERALPGSNVLHLVRLDKNQHRLHQYPKSLCGDYLVQELTRTPYDFGTPADPVGKNAKILACQACQAAVPNEPPDLPKPRPAYPRKGQVAIILNNTDADWIYNELDKKNTRALRIRDAIDFARRES